MLILLAFANGWAEEVIVVGFLLTRLQQLRVNPVVALVATSLLRGAYHLYQGWGAGLGNVAMGLVFGYVWRRTGRLWPLVDRARRDRHRRVRRLHPARGSSWLAEVTGRVHSFCERRPAASAPTSDGASRRR